MGVSKKALKVSGSMDWKFEKATIKSVPGTASVAEEGPATSAELTAGDWEGPSMEKRSAPPPSSQKSRMCCAMGLEIPSCKFLTNIRDSMSRERKVPMASGIRSSFSFCYFNKCLVIYKMSCKKDKYTLSCMRDVKVFGVTECRGIKLNYGGAWNKGGEGKYFGIGRLLHLVSH